ncbi:hypothetical protein A2Z33_00480 [Candidatus Gottesmanbacteria bacterium RBG_16_52_11]|uniref:Uncharacterized protein n=1 Tax=Candidatus Gottesmanbacteria bacterium RBG_16_52_11 TaxID=1798374 RepID=A0A1F5YNN9_9BACT|nr:MAG: hypothetical protein A2Z33_00480 [Candidatus Gottesmanbacteria bacterium RBG_16_52_11]
MEVMGTDPNEKTPKAPTVISVEGSQNAVWSDTPGAVPVTNIPILQTQPQDVHGLIIIPGEAPTKWEKFKETALEVLTEYTQRARAMRLPAPVISPPVTGQPIQPTRPAPAPAQAAAPAQPQVMIAARHTEQPVSRIVPENLVIVPIQPQEPQSLYPSIPPASRLAARPSAFARPVNPPAASAAGTDDLALISSIVSSASNEFTETWRPMRAKEVTTPDSGYQIGVHSAKTMPAAEETPKRKPASQEYIGEGYQVFGRVISADVENKPAAIVRIISMIFFGMTVSYATLTLVLFGTILALAIALTHAGSPEFIFLKYFPTVGILPVLSCLVMIAFLYISYKIRDGSRISWTLALASLIAFPVTFAYFMPVLSFPLVKLVATYAGSPTKQIPLPVLTVGELGRLFSLFLVFEGVTVLLIIFARAFSHRSNPLPQAARMSITLVIFLFLLPVTTVTAYGYFNSQTTDFGYTNAAGSVRYRIFTPFGTPGGRVNSSKFLANEELAGTFNAVRVTYDVPLPAIIQTGFSSPITVVQTEVRPDFAIRKFVGDLDRSANTLIEPVPVANAKDAIGYATSKGPTHYLTLLKPDNILILLSSPVADTGELVSFAESLE